MVGRTHHPGTWASMMFGIAIVYLLLKGRMSSRVSCVLAAQSGIQTQAHGLAAGHAEIYSTGELTMGGLQIHFEADVECEI